jgi:hypothetical protein
LGKAGQRRAGRPEVDAMGIDANAEELLNEMPVAAADMEQGFNSGNLKHAMDAFDVVDVR